jgi:hypothetical protein
MLMKRNACFQDIINEGGNMSEILNPDPVIYININKRARFRRILEFWPVQNLYYLNCLRVFSVQVTDVFYYLYTTNAELRFFAENNHFRPFKISEDRI